ncbi:hypothetical protein ACFYNO_34950 [Kitasatospora sp. NPDC006697]|uniref:hypothetical protein n=1 Tax=Kitasatospora sp. NPDC006697 TaxID=3364020 RepID=UPI0036C4ED0B
MGERVHPPNAGEWTLDPELTALAGTAGTAIAQAVGTDAWHGLRAAAARVFHRGHAPEAAQQTALDRLDRSSAELERVEPGATERARGQVASSWQTRFRDLLEELDEADRHQVAAQLRELVALAGRSGGTSAGDDSIVIKGDVRIEARESSVAGVNVTMGDVTFGTPPPPGANQG